LTRDEWAVVGPLLPPERGRANRPSHDNRRVLNGMLWVAQTGASWRSLPAEYGKWNSVYRRFERWSEAGICDKVARALARLAAAEGGRRDAGRASVRVRIRAAAFKALIKERKKAAERAPSARPRTARARAR
jgi:transposase